MSLTPREILAAGRLVAVKAAPYFRALLHSFEPRETPGLGTVGCTDQGILIWDPDFVRDLEVLEMAAVWLHETMHRMHRHGARRGSRDPKLFNMGADLAINPAVQDMGLPFPKGDKAPLMPEKYGWERGLTADEYFERLRKLPPDQRGNKGAGGEEDGSGDGEESESGGEGSESKKKKAPPGRGHCGSCAGNPLPEEPTDAQRSQQELERAERQTAEAIRDYASNNRGALPAGLKRWADEVLAPPRIPWEQKLARIVRGSIARRSGAVDHRWDGFGRRQAGLGYGPGCPIMPRLRAPIPEVAVIIDTSGSMGSKELADGLRELGGILKATHAKVTFATCDSELHGINEVRTLAEAAQLLKGGGGTDMRPAFEALEKKRPRPDLVVCVTDGMVGGGVPAREPPGLRTVWVLVGPYRCAPCSWGQQLEIVPDGEQPKLKQ